MYFSGTGGEKEPDEMLLGECYNWNASNEKAFFFLLEIFLIWEGQIIAGGFSLKILMYRQVGLERAVLLKYRIDSYTLYNWLSGSLTW